MLLSENLSTNIYHKHERIVFFFILDNLRAPCGYTGFVWQSLVVGGDRGGCCEELLKASKGANCGITELRRGTIVQQPATAERRGKMWETAVQTPGQWGGGDAPEQIPLQPHYFSSSYSNLIGSKIKPISQAWFAWDSNWWVISPCPYLDPWTFYYFLSPVQLRNGYINPQESQQSATN